MLFSVYSVLVVLISISISFQTCFYCKLRGASIGCDQRACRKSFHFPCGLENNCLTQFCGKYRSFCHLHHAIDRSTVHGDNELCVLCDKSMGKFHPVSSVELGCCGRKWQHSKCLRYSLYNQNSDMYITPICTSCGNEDEFHVFLKSNGIFVPER